MTEHEWVKGFPGKIEVCDADGVLLEMNDRAAEQEGEAVLGTNILDCHPEPSRSKLKAMLESGRENIYTIQKKGKKKLVYQTPWYRDGQYAGFVEMVLDIPETMPHFNRDKPATSGG